MTSQVCVDKRDLINMFNDSKEQWGGYYRMKIKKPLDTTTAAAFDMTKALANELSRLQ